MTAFLAPDPIQSTQLIPGTVVPASGGLLFCYQAGTSTKLNTYTDPTASTARANPIVLDSGGNIPGNGEVWITSTAKFVLAPFNDTDPPVSPYWSRDNYSGTNNITSQLAGAEWVVGPAPTFVSATSFTLVGDQTLIFSAGRRVKTTNTGGTVYSGISTSTFAGGTTTITVSNDSGVLDAGLSAVSYSLLSQVNSSQGFLQSGAGAVAEPVQTSLRRIVAPPQFNTAANYQAAATANTSEISAGFIAAGGATNFNVPADGAAGIEVIDTNAARKGVVVSSYGSAAAPYMHWQAARGTQAAPTKALANDTIMSLGGRGYTGTAFSASQVAIIGKILADADTAAHSSLSLEVSDTSGVRNPALDLRYSGNTMPLQPAFLASATATANVTGNATVATVIWGTEIYDQRGNFAANTFTATVTGIYHFNVIMRGTGLAAGNTFLSVSLVTTARTIALIEINPSAIIFGATALTLSGGIDVPMASGDTATVTFRVDGGTQIVGYTASSFFSGRLVC